VREEDRHRLDESIEHDLTGRSPSLGSGPPSELLMAADTPPFEGSTGSVAVSVTDCGLRRLHYGHGSVTSPS
jgi:hypothetical protein